MDGDNVQTKGRSSSSLSSSTSGTPSTSDDGVGTKPSKLDNSQKLQPQNISSTSISAGQPDSSSTADIPSEVFAEGDSQQTDQKMHRHKLPSGWACNYDPETDEYNFELVHNREGQSSAFLKATYDRGVNVRSPTHDRIVQTSRRPTLHIYECEYGYHFPSSPTSSMISELARQVQKAGLQGTKQAISKSRQIGYGKSKLIVPSDDEEQIRRLRDMFPTATELVIEQMIRIYHGREGLIKAALISLGYKRLNEYDSRQAAAQSPVMLMMSRPSSKKLYEKLVSYFPDRDENLIKSLMYKHKEVEHEVISALVEFGHRDVRDQKLYEHRTVTDDAMARADKNGAIMKLRYLKTLYPTCEEIELYHLLNCNDLNAQKVMETVESRGHKRANIDEVMENRKSQLKQMRAQQAAHAAKEKLPSAQDLVEAHKKRTKPSIEENRLAALTTSLKANFEHLEDGFLQAALEAAEYNEGLAKKFLDEMKPIDESLYMQRYRLPQENQPDVIAFPCKAIQKSGTNFMSIISNEYVLIPREVIQCNQALALLKVDASTYTGEDFPQIKFTCRRGIKQDLRIGSQFAEAIKHKLEELKTRVTRPQISRKHGSNYVEICASHDRPKPNSRANGQNKALVHGKDPLLRLGRNPKLLERTHPFFRSVSVEPI